MADANKDKALFLFVLAIVVLAFGLISDISITTFWLISGFALLLIALIHFAAFLGWRRGAKGEELVMTRLMELKDYRIINDLVLPNMNGNIDHIAIGSKGIFLVETKYRTKFKKYDDDLKTMKARAMKLKEFISVQKIFSEGFAPWINTILVLTGPQENAGYDQQENIVLLENLIPKIQNNKTKVRLTRNEIDELYAILKAESLTPQKELSTLRNIGRIYSFANYLQYIKFAILWGTIFALVATLITLELNFVDTWLYGVLFNGVILFVLGKCMLDFFEIRIRSSILRLSATHFLSYLPLLIAVIAIDIHLRIDTPDWIYIAAELLIRLAIIILVVLVYKLFKWKVPN